MPHSVPFCNQSAMKSSMTASLFLNPRYSATNFNNDSQDSMEINPTVRKVLEQKFGPTWNMSTHDGQLYNFETESVGIRKLHNVYVNTTKVPRGTVVQVFDLVHQVMMPK